MAVNSTNEIDVFADHGNKYDSVKVTSMPIELMSIAWCGSYWITGGKLRSTNELTIFFSEDGKQWVVRKSSKGDYRSKVLLACDGASIIAGTGDALVASSDRGANWHSVDLKDVGEMSVAISGGVQAVTIKGGVADALLRVKLIDWEYCEGNGGEMTCRPTRLWGMGSMVHSGAKICIGGRNNVLGDVYVSLNRGKEWNSGGSSPADLNEGVTSLFADGNRVFAGTDWHGVLSSENCQSWKAVRADLLTNIRSIVSDGKYLYAGAEGGVYRFAMSAVGEKKPAAFSPNHSSKRLKP